MIKLIITDLDGTLFNDHNELPEDFECVLSALNKKGIVFAAGSGRTWLTQRSHFSQFTDRMKFICDNGAMVIEESKPSFVSIIQLERWLRVTAYFKQNNFPAALILCGTKGTYCLKYDKQSEFGTTIETAYSNLTIVHDLYAVKDDIFKISICCPYGAENLFHYLTEQFSNWFSIQLTHPQFIDMMNIGISKGSGLKFLQNSLSISKEETMVFGDYYNDIEMLKEAEFSFVMQNAPEDVQKQGKYIAPSNNKNGVTQMIKEYVLSQT